MAVAQVYTAVANDVITAARWNNEFGNIYNNGTDIAFPLTKAASLAGFTLTLDAAGVTTLSSTASQALSFTPGAKSGTPNTTGKSFNMVANTFTDSNTAGSGTATSFAAFAIQQPTLAATNTSVTTTDAATVYIANAPAAGTNETLTNKYALWVDNGDVRFDGGLVGNLLVGNPISGLIQSNSVGDATNDITISIGAASSDNAALADKRLMSLTSAITKQLDATWAVGTNAGGLDTGAIADSDYYIFLIHRKDTGVTDALFSLSSTAPTMPTGYAYKRLIGWIKRTAGAIVAFTAYESTGGGLAYQWTTPTLDVDLAATLTTTRRTDALRVPLNISTLAHIRTMCLDAAATSNAILLNPDETDTAPSMTTAPGANVRIHVAGQAITEELFIRTSAAGLLAARANVATMDNYRVVTVGFEMSRR